MSLTAQEVATETIKLLPPDLKRGKGTMQALMERSSVQALDTVELSLRDLSDLMWAANGINRPANGKRTAPSAQNSQEVDVYTCTAKGIYRYDAAVHVLAQVATGDYRALAASRQAWVAKAPVIVLLVADISKFKGGEEAQRLNWGAMDVGIVSQNISVYCSAVGLGTRPRAFMEVDKLSAILKLQPSQKLMLNHPVGYKVK